MAASKMRKAIAAASAAAQKEKRGAGGDSKRQRTRRSEQQEMKKRGFKTLLICTQVDESAQFFYRKLEYIDCGGLVFQGTPFSQSMEMFMRKVVG